MWMRRTRTCPTLLLILHILLSFSTTHRCRAEDVVPGWWSAPSGHREEVVVFKARALDSCRAARLESLVSSAGSSRKVYFLYDKNGHEASNISLALAASIPGLISERQPKFPHALALRGFGGRTTGKTMPSFLAWAYHKSKEMGKSNDAHIWHIEDDGAWSWASS